MTSVGLGFWVQGLGIRARNQQLREKSSTKTDTTIPQIGTYFKMGVYGLGLQVLPGVPSIPCKGTTKMYRTLLAACTGGAPS